MNRILAVVFALFCATLSISSACFAQPADWVSFTLQPERNDPAKIHASFRDQTRERDHDNWSTAFMPSELIGMEVSSFHGSGTRPLHFAIVREEGSIAPATAETATLQAIAGSRRTPASRSFWSAAASDSRRASRRSG